MRGSKQMTIGRFVELSGLSADTLRYYEKVNLLRGIRRDKAGRRIFQPENLNWIRFIKRLKDTGMPLAEIRRYSYLREKGEPTLEDRLKLLKQHALLLTDKITADQNKSTTPTRGGGLRWPYKGLSYLKSLP